MSDRFRRILSSRMAVVVPAKPPPTIAIRVFLVTGQFRLFGRMVYLLQARLSELRLSELRSRRFNLIQAFGCERSQMVTVDHMSSLRDSESCVCVPDLVETQSY